MGSSGRVRLIPLPIRNLQEGLYRGDWSAALSTECIRVLSFSWEFPSRMAIESLGVDKYLRKLVENDKKSHKEVSILLQQAYPGVNGLSERSVRRFCAQHSICSRDRRLSTADLDAVVSSAIAEVNICTVLSVF